MSWLVFIRECFEHAITHGPSNHLFSWLRWHYYRGYLEKGSGQFTSLSGLLISGPDAVFIGDNVSINRDVTIDASDGGHIRIGNNCLIGPYVLIRSADHTFANPLQPIRTQGHTAGCIVIEDNCWIGGHVTVTKGVTIGTGSVIGANSVVTRDIPPFTLAAGNPANVIRPLKPAEAAG